MSAKICAKEVDNNRTQYLVVFKEPSERNTDTMSTVLNRGKSQKTPERDGVIYLAAADNAAETKVYHPLGIAAADLDESQFKTLSDRDDVEQIVENEIRSLPPTRRPLIRMESDGYMLAYLQGMRDATMLALAFHEGRQLPAIGPQLAQVTTPHIAAPASDITWGLKAIGVADASPVLTGKGVKVAILDTGLDLHHPDFLGRVEENKTAVSFVTGINVQDVNGHGTHCAGTVCGPRDSFGGVRYSVAPEAELLIGKVFNNSIRPRATDDDILEGITWAETNGARIISISLSSRRTDATFPLPYEAIAQRLLERNQNSVLLIAAAGNASDRPTSVISVENPAACPSIMAVAAIDSEKRIAPFSCRQMDIDGKVDVAAPGVGIYSSMAGGTFDELDGTSMAVPHVTGLAALYLERNQSLTARQLFDELQARAISLGDVEDFGAGLVQL